MSLLRLFCLSCILINFISTSSDVCKVVTVENNIFQNGKRLQGFQYYQSLFVPDVLQCARMCFFRRRCLSFNYNENMEICEFNNARVDPPYVILNTSNDYLYSNIDDWDEAIGMGPCQKQPCGICDVCYPTEFKYTCVKEELTSCRDIKICTNASSDGHYMVKPMMGMKPWLKVYCHYMNSTYPRDYITLINENFSKYPPLGRPTCNAVNWTLRNPGAIFYHKIRLELVTLRVKVKDRTFTNISCEPRLFGISDTLSFQKSGINCSVKLDYGKAGDCMVESCNPRKGIVQIDLQGTGLVVSPSSPGEICSVKLDYGKAGDYMNKICIRRGGTVLINLKGKGLVVSPSVSWTTKGRKHRISSFNRSATNEVINVTCGGTCGRCYPKGNLILEPKT